MSKKSSGLNMEDFKEHAVKTAESWLEAILHDRFSVSAELCSQFISRYKTGFLEHTFQIREDEYNEILVVLVFIRGLLDYVQMCQTTASNENWFQSQQLLESVWVSICDCRERLTFSYYRCQGEVVNLVFCSLDKLEEFYFERFGSGYYVSPGIEADGSSCSICMRDMRACSHIPGRLYSGVFCTIELINPYIKHVAVVDAPVDRRCRIWPWNLEDDQGGNTKARLMLMCTFSVDDFLYDSKKSAEQDK